MVITLTVIAKGQITLRKEVLRRLGVRSGDKLDVDLLKEGRLQLGLKRGTSAVAQALRAFLALVLALYYVNYHAELGSLHEVRDRGGGGIPVNRGRRAGRPLGF